MFEALGLSRFDEQVLVALSTGQADSTGGLAQLLAVPEGEVSRSISRLQPLGLVQQATITGRYLATPPDLALRELVDRRAAEVEAARRGVAELTYRYQQSNLERHPQSLIDVITGPDAVVAYTVDVYRRPKTEVLSFDRPPYSAVHYNEFNEVAEEAPQLASTTWQVIYSISALRIPGRFERVSQLARQGEEARVAPDLPVKVHIIDRRFALLPLTTNGVATTSIAVIHESSLLDGLIALFQAYWQTAIPLPRTVASAIAQTAASQPTEMQRHIIAMMASGATDETIARNLDVSDRTARRRISDIIDLLGGRGRFHAGLEAGRRGWIRYPHDPPDEAGPH